MTSFTKSSFGYNVSSNDLFYTFSISVQSKFIEENPRETWSPAPPVTPPPPPARTVKSTKSSSRYSPYFVRDGPRSPVILFNEPPRAATPEEVALPPQPPMLGPLPPISEILGLTLPQPESTFVVRDSPESPTYIVRDSPESPNSESWKFDPIFNWQVNVDRKSSSYENTNPDQTEGECFVKRSNLATFRRRP